MLYIYIKFKFIRTNLNKLKYIGYTKIKQNKSEYHKTNQNKYEDIGINEKS